MIYSGRKLFGFRELLRRKHLKIKEPEEFQGTRVVGVTIAKERKEAKPFSSKSSQPTSYLSG
jgi:hypothetical protein